MSTCDSLATSETISETAEDDEALETVVDDDTVDAVEALDDELDDCSAASRLARSVSSADKRLLALDELSVEVDEADEAESLEGSGPGGGPPTPPVEASPAELRLLSEPPPPSCDRKASTAADNPIAVEASETEIALLAEALDDVEAVVLALVWLDELL